MRAVFNLLKVTYANWSRSNASFLAAGLAYFTVFSLVPLIILAIAMAGLIFGQAAAEGVIVQQIGGLVGEDAARGIQEILVNAHRSGIGTATVLSVALLLMGAAQLFSQLQIALNMVWGIQPSQTRIGFKRGVLNFVKKRLIAFGMVGGIGFLITLFFFADASLSFMKNLLGDMMPFLEHFRFWTMMSSLASFILTTLLTAVIYHLLPETDTTWGDVWIGAAVTSLLIGLGRYLINLYFTFANPGSVYGVAGSVIVIFVAIYLSAQIFLFGAEFTWSYANLYGSKAPHAAAPAPI